MISSRFAGQYQLSTAECHKYLGEHLHFELGTAERLGAELFFRFAHELGLLPQAELDFFECSKA
jgi:hypothetical protein